MSHGVSRRLIPDRRRRDRHGRGLQGMLAPADVPLSKSRADRFDELVRDAVERIERRWRTELARVEFAVEDVPALDDWEHEWVPLARSFIAQGALPPRIVIFRRPLETRAISQRDLGALIHDVVVEEVAELLGMDPGQVDPGYTAPDDEDS